MAIQQEYRGNPALKQYMLTNNFIGGLNTKSADDVVADVEFRELLNVDLGNQGILRNRKGFQTLTVFNTMMTNAVDDAGDPATFPEGTVRIAKVAKDTYNIVQKLADYDDIDAFRLYLQPYEYELVIIFLIDSDFYRLKISKQKTVLQETVEFSRQYRISTDGAAEEYTLLDTTYIFSGTQDKLISVTDPLDGYELLEAKIVAIEYQNYNEGDDTGTLTVSLPVVGEIVNESEVLTNTYMSFVDYPGLGELNYDFTSELDEDSEVTISVSEDYPETSIFRFVMQYTYQQSESAVEAQNLGEFKSIISLNSVEFLDDVYFNPGDGNLYDYNIVEDRTTKATAFQPTPFEVKYIGFNVLAEDPLSYIDDQGITSKAITGVYLTYEYNRPALVIPTGGRFQINIIHTGDIADTDLNIQFFRYSEADSDYTDEITPTSVSISDQGGVFVADVLFGSLNNITDIMITIEDVNDPITFDPYTAIYGIGGVTTEEISKLDLVGMRMLEIKNRLVVYGRKEIWFSDLYNFGYIPNYNYVTLPLGTTDEIVKIAYFRGSYIIFTKEEIYKMSGTFGGDDFYIASVNKFIGCIAPNTVRNVGNELLFLSRDGLYKLKSSVFQDNLENVEKIDDYISDDIVATENADALLYNEQYILYYNNGEDYDSYRYYYNIQLGKGRSPYVRDIYSAKPELIVAESGIIFALQNGAWYQYDKGYTDFMPEGETDNTDYLYDVKLETAALSLRYPTHQKKFKNVFIKALHGDKVVPLFVTIKVDGYDALNPYNYTVGRGQEGEIEYIETRDANITLVSSAFLGELELGFTPLGEITQGVHKLSFSGKGKNIKIIIEQKLDSSFGIIDIGYLYKLGKVKAD